MIGWLPALRLASLSFGIQPNPEAALGRHLFVIGKGSTWRSTCFVISFPFVGALRDHRQRCRLSEQHFEKSAA